MDSGLVNVLVTFRFGDKSITKFVKATSDGDDGWHFKKGTLDKYALELGVAPGEAFTVTPALN